MQLFQILLPLRDNCGRQFAREEFDRIKNELAHEYGGVTAYLQSPAEGFWQQAGDTHRDDVVIFEVMADEIDLVCWRERQGELERRLRQDKVVIRYLPIALV